jgi:hypothetical protein
MTPTILSIVSDSTGDTTRCCRCRSPIGSDTTSSSAGARGAKETRASDSIARPETLSRKSWPESAAVAVLVSCSMHAECNPARCGESTPTPRPHVGSARRSESPLAHNRRFRAIPSSFAGNRERVIHPCDQLSTVRDGGAARGTGRVSVPRGRPATRATVARIGNTGVSTRPTVGRVSRFTVKREIPAPPWGSGRAIALSCTSPSVAAPDARPGGS